MTRSLDLAVAAVAASSLAADAAVGAVAEPGSRTGRVGDFGRGFVNDGGDGRVGDIRRGFVNDGGDGRVGDFGRGFVNDGGDEGPGFFPGLSAGFDAAAGALGATDDRLGFSAVVFFASLTSVFGSFEVADFGDIFLDDGCLLGVAAFLGVVGAETVDV